MEALLQTNPSGNDPAAALASPSNVLASLAEPRTIPQPSTISQGGSWPAVAWLPMQLSVALPIPRFRVRDLLALDPGQIIATAWPNGDDLPLSIEDVQLAWIEMEVVDQDIAVRITRLL